MFRMMCKDLRISPLRTFLTGFSMFIGIVAMIASVLVSALGKGFLLGVNAQLFGYTPTYVLTISGANLADPENADRLFEKLRQTSGKALVIEPEKGLRFASLESTQQLEGIRNMDSAEQAQKMRHLHKSLAHLKISEVVYTMSGYNDAYNMPLSRSRWFNKPNEMSSLEVVLNKPGYSTCHSACVVSSKSDTLNLTPFNVVGVVNDGKDLSTMYVNIAPLASCMPNLFATEHVRVYWHDREGLSMDKMQSRVDDICTIRLEERLWT